MSKRKRARRSQEKIERPSAVVATIAVATPQRTPPLEKIRAWGIERLATARDGSRGVVSPAGGYFRRNRPWLLPVLIIGIITAAQPLGLLLTWPKGLPRWVPVLSLMGMLICLLAFGYGLLRTRTATTAVILRLMRSAILFVAVVVIYQAIRRW
jgi:hypothetical protein